MHTLPPQSDLDRFWSQVNFGSGAGCWEWAGKWNQQRGYGWFTGKHSGGRQYAHRYVYAAINGEIPKGIYICHRCDNPRCVRPDHLFAGTPRENIRDAMAKGRMKGFVSQRKLSDADVLDILRLHDQGIGHPDIAQQFGVTTQWVARIIAGARRVDITV